MPLNSPLIFKEIFRNSESTSILIFDTTGQIEDINIGFQKFLGYSRESIIGKNFSELYIEEDLRKDLPTKVMKKILETGSSHDDNYLKHADGSHIWIHGECIYAKDEKGQGHVVKIIQDLNKAKLLEQKLKEENEVQERIIKDNGTFIYTASHDLISPVNNIEAIINSLEVSLNNPGEIEFLIPLMKDSMERLRKKINELSEIGKEQEAEKKEKSVVEFEETYNDVLRDLEEEIKHSGAEISSDFSPAPSIIFSKKNLKSIIQNLVSNSVKYRSPDRKLKISVRTEKVRDSHILLKVQDNGLGIKEGDKNRIFLMYQRAHTHMEGTGVGLGIVKKIIENTGGTIELESTVGEGSTFNIYMKT